MKLKAVDFLHKLDANIKIMRQQGLLLTSVDSAGQPNTMTIGWGNPGVIWGKPVFVVFVRPTRHTFANIEASGEFVVSVPTPRMKKECSHCGTVSGRDHDKFADCGFTLTDGTAVHVPLIDQCVMHYECRVVHRNDVIESQLDPAVRQACYPSGNFHRIYYGEILRASAKE